MNKPTVTLATWKRADPNYKTGTWKKNPRMLMLVNGATCLVPVEVV